jgi:hypothetical protein
MVSLLFVLLFTWMVLRKADTSGEVGIGFLGVKFHVKINRGPAGAASRRHRQHR